MLGFGAVLVGVRLADAIGIVCAVLGFLAIVAGADVAVRLASQLRRRRRPPRPEPAT